MSATEQKSNFVSSLIRSSKLAKKRKLYFSEISGIMELFVKRKIPFKFKAGTLKDPFPKPGGLCTDIKEKYVMRFVDELSFKEFVNDFEILGI